MSANETFSAHQLALALGVTDTSVRAWIRKISPTAMVRQARRYAISDLPQPFVSRLTRRWIEAEKVIGANSWRDLEHFVSDPLGHRLKAASTK